MVDWRKTSGEGSLPAHTEMVEGQPVSIGGVFRYALDRNAGFVHSILAFQFVNLIET